VRRAHDVPDLFTSSASADIVVFVLGVLGVTTEFRYQTITPTFLAEPRRARVVGAKLVAHVAVGFGYGLVGLVMAFLVGGTVIKIRGAALGLDTPGLAKAALLSALGVGLWTLLGIGIGTLIRNQVAAILIGVLITFLLDAARLSSGQLKLAIVPMDLTALAAQVQADLSRPELVPIEVAGERLLVPVDGDRFRTILTALVEACRWWGEEGPVRIEVEPGPPVVVRVSRSKTALDRERARELFGPRPPGSGGGSKVGLFVANGLAKAHGGTLEVDVDDRIEFVVTLPATPER